MKAISTAIVFGCFLISPNLLYMLGVGYSSTGGGMLEKIHPCSYLSLFVFLFFVFSGRKNRINCVSDRELKLYIGAIFLLSAYCIGMGYVASIPVVTLLTPLLIFFMLEHSSPSFLLRLGYWVRILLAANAILGISEAVTGVTILERVAGDVVVTSDARSIGFIGLPLTSSLVSALVVVFLVRESIEEKVSALRGLEIALHLIALVAFGGRVALLSTLLLSSWAVLFGKSKAGSKSIGKSQLIVRICVFSLMLGLVVLILTTDFADNVMSRFAGDDNADRSSESRLSALLILLDMDPMEWLFGVSEVRRVSLMGAFDTDFGIEITWVSWVMSFGFLWSVFLMYMLYRIIRLTLRGRSSSLGYMSLMFLIAITSAQGLGGKTLMLAWFLIMLVTFDAQSLRAIVARKIYK